ncbi:MAG TPA: EF-P lysine aminoacylase EpmA, partial [Steroidobacteraceae bacterium]|nr:EF-P lysine aminoacylase EpmA [Steroidobacteraceae bacterium]
MSESPREDWRPTATREMLQRRAELLASARAFFAERHVLEVDTPAVVNAAVTDVHIHSARVTFADPASGRALPASRPYFLHTSPEYAMKRLLAAGSGDIYQICHVVRGLERGRQHNAEFTLIEWYRLGFSLDDLMSEVDALVRRLLGNAAADLSSERLTYREAFVREARLDPLAAGLDELESLARTVGYSGSSSQASAGQRDELLELLMGTLVGPRLGSGSLTFIHGYPATQAALARLDPRAPGTALRFELYCRGIELANGFQELASASEQRSRFEHDNAERRRLGLPAHDIDERLLAALGSGLPECSGVALGFDRTLMLA